MSEDCVTRSPVAANKATTTQRQFAEIEEYALSKAGTPVKLAVGDKARIMA